MALADCKRLRGEIEAHPSAATQYREQRHAVDLFLLDRSTHRETWRPPRAWVALRRRLQAAEIGFENALREFYALLSTAPYWTEDDAAEAERSRMGRVNLSKRRRARLAKVGAAVQTLAAVARDRQALLNVHLEEIPCEEPTTGERLRQIVTLGDTLPSPTEPARSKLRPGSGRPNAQETAQDEMMRFLEALRLSERAAEQVTREALLWFAGQTFAANTIRIRRLRATRKGL
jgi:hypothetical protein